MIGFDEDKVTPAHEAWYTVVGARPVGSGPKSDEELSALDDALPLVEAAAHLARAQVLADHGETERADREVVAALRRLDGHDDPQAASLAYEAWTLVADLVEEHSDLAGPDRALDAGVEKVAAAVRADDPALWLSATIQAGTTLGSELIRVGRTGEAEMVLRSGIELALRRREYVELDAGFGCAATLVRLARETDDEDLLDEARRRARDVIDAAAEEGYDDLAADLWESYERLAG